MMFFKAIDMKIAIVIYPHHIIPPFFAIGSITRMLLNVSPANALSISTLPTQDTLKL